MLLALFTSLLLIYTLQAQRLDIQLNKNVLQPGDSLQVTVVYKGDSGQVSSPSLATLEMLIQNEQGQRTRLRWPMVNGQATGSIYLPDSLPQGLYTLFAGLQERFFEVKGEIRNAPNTKRIQAMLLTQSGDWDEQEVSVTSNGTFTINNWLFEDNGLMAFSTTNKEQQPLDIRISTQLDSSFQPLAVAGRSFYLGNLPAEKQSTLNQSVETSEILFADEGTTLPAVIVRTTTKSPAQQFEDEYVSGLFRSANERVVSILEDPNANSYTNIFTYLQSRIAGLQITPLGMDGGAARWRGRPVTFFMDEVRVSSQQAASIPMIDIAIVKAFPPPFFGAPGGGGAVAIYTRRGGERDYLPTGRQVFRVRGYTPSATALDMGKLNL